MAKTTVVTFSCDRCGEPLEQQTMIIVRIEVERGNRFTADMSVECFHKFLAFFQNFKYDHHA